MQKGIKFRIYPNREQKNFIHQTLGCCRFIYNRGLAMRKEGYENGEKIGYSQTSAMLTELKKQEEFAFLKDSYNREKQRIRVARVYEKATNQRNDFLQKQSTMLVRENQTICIEDLNVKGMIRNHKLSKSIASVSWAKFFEMLEYKAGWYGNEIHRVPTMYPSSQTCSCCGYRNPRIKNLGIRIWECPKCHAVHDRDTNASINILKKGLQMQSA